MIYYPSVLLLKSLPSKMAVICMLFVSACSKTPPSTSVTVSGATSAALYAVELVQQTVVSSRPSASLGVYASLYVSQGGFFGVQTAMAGIDAASSLVKPLDPDALDEAYLLLQEFGGVLQEDVPDLLNRSIDRPSALNEYVTGLSNITLRAQQKANELDAAIDDKNRERQVQQRALSDIDRRVRDASRLQDYATVGTLQRNRSEAQAELDGTNSDIKRLRDIFGIYEDLLDIAVERSAAIDANREILIAGLQVIDIPGIEDLDILLDSKSRRGSGSENDGLGGVLSGGF